MAQRYCFNYAKNRLLLQYGGKRYEENVDYAVYRTFHDQLDLINPDNQPVSSQIMLDIKII